MDILGISCFYHDAAACLLRDGRILAAAEEERFSRRKHDSGFPEHAIRFCLEAAEIVPEELDYVIFYEKPLLKFERICREFPQLARRVRASDADLVERQAVDQKPDQKAAWLQRIHSVW